MIQEIINYIEHLQEKSPQIIEKGLEPSKGLHIFVEFNEEGNSINFPGEKGENWDFYDGKEKSEFINKIVSYDIATTYITMNKQKKFDPKQKIHSASPFSVAFNFNFNDSDKKKYGIKKKPNNEEKRENDRLIKQKRIEVVLERIDEYFKNISLNFKLNDKQAQLVALFKTFIVNYFNGFGNGESCKSDEFKKYWEKIKVKEYFKIYLKNVSLEEYENIYKPYLNKNIFNKEKFNIASDKQIFGAIDYHTTFSDNKMFLKHQTGIFKDGIGYRFNGDDAQLLNLFEKLKFSNIFPNPLPLFVDKNEFKNTDEIISIFKENQNLKYSQIIKKLFTTDKERILKNYYLLFFNGIKVEDFDFVSTFRYSLKENEQYPEIINLYELKDNQELKPNYTIKNIHYFEINILKTIFNNSLVKIDEKKNTFSVHYFGEIKPEYVSGGDPIYQMILKYRKAFYDYIYKSKTETINSKIWDEINWSSIIGDLRNTNYDKKYYIEQGIKEKLNIWFSLYNYFSNNKGRVIMASKIPELLRKMKNVANEENVHFETIEEFVFGAGQIIYFLLNQSKASARTHALLEPFIQKVKAEQLQNAIAQAINTYKHELSFGQGRFERLSSEVLGFYTDENLKEYQKLLLAGYFATPVIYE